MPQRFFVAWAILLTLKPNIFILWLSVISVWTCDMLLLLLLSRFRCVRLCATPHGSPPGSPVPRILQARTWEWVAFSNAWKWKVKVKSLSRVQPLGPHRLQPTRLLHLWDFPGKSTGVGCHFLLPCDINNLNYSRSLLSKSIVVLLYSAWIPYTKEFLTLRSETGGLMHRRREHIK